MSAAPVIDFWFEFASTYSYPAAARIGELARARGCRVRFRPFLLGPIFKAQGWSDSPFNIYPAKGRYMWRDLERICAALELPFARPSQFPRNGLHAARVACLADLASDNADDGAWLEPFVVRVYRASFADDRDIADPAVLRDCLTDLVPDPAATLERAGQDAAKAHLRANTDQAIALGIFGAPTCSVGDELFWGNDRLEAALDAALQTA